jgi:flagellar biosynthesis/type III secretory pathway M-ring protein FliF/YscJ
MAVGGGVRMRAGGLLIGAVVAVVGAIWLLPAGAVTGGAAVSIAAVGQRTDALSEPAQKALDRVLGAGHCLVTASATYGAASSRRTTSYDPRHGAALRQSRASSPGYQASVTDNGVSSTITDSTTAGQVQRITVAVVVDSGLRPAPKRATIRKIVTAAMGLQTARGDRISIARSALAPAGTTGSAAAAPVPPASSGPARISAYLPSAVGVGVGLVLMFTLALDPGRRRREPAVLDVLGRG